jgi:hypothetical protein
MTDLVLLSRDGDIATVALNRGERMNAFNLAMWDALEEVMAEVNGDAGLRCVVLRGAGEAPFGAGADIAEFETVRADAAQARAYARRLDAAMEAVADDPRRLRRRRAGAGAQLRSQGLRRGRALRHPHQPHRTLPADACHAGPGGAGRSLCRS